jgi:hypothetical protein
MVRPERVIAVDIALMQMAGSSPAMTMKGRPA